MSDSVDTEGGGNKAAEYNRTYYTKNQERLKEYRRNRYRDDPEYREQCIQRALERKQRLAEQRYREGGPKPRRNFLEPGYFLISLGDTEVKVKMFTIGVLAKRFGRGVKTLRMWERRGTIPSAMYRDSGGRSGNRLYTEFQVEKLVAIFKEAIEVNGRRMVKNRINKTVFPELARKLWEDYPLGIDPEQY